MKIHLLVLFLLVSLCAVTCKKNPITPPPPTGGDTTSHAFTFQTFTFGGAGGSILNDVAIINDTLVYAVGEIYQTDSAGQYDPDPYNLAIWDGRTWTLQKVPYYYQGQPFYSSIYSIFAFNSEDIWFEAGIHWDGRQFNTIPLNIGFPSHVNKMWGSSSNDLYIVGNGGLIAHRDASGNWTTIQSGTKLPINDIWGAQNSLGQWEILAIASNPDSTANMLLQINSNNTVTPLSTDGLLPFATGVWFVPEQKYYVVGSGIGQKSSLNDPSWSVYPSGEVTSYASSAIYGQGLNDIFVAGSFMEVVHYNGSTWYKYKDKIPFGNGALGGISFKGNTVAIVGYIDQQAVAIIGRRQ